MSKFQPIPLDNVRALLSTKRFLELPESGEITFKFHRSPATLVEPFEGQPAKVSGELQLIEIVAVKEVEDEPAEAESGDEAVDRLFEQARSNSPAPGVEEEDEE